MPGLPAELAPQLGRVDGVAAVVAGAVLDPIEIVGVLTHHLEDHPEHRNVVLLPVCADEVGLARAAFGEYRPHGRAVILGVDPVAHVLARAVELGAHAVDDVRYLARDELLHVLVGAVVVAAVADGGTQAVDPRPQIQIDPLVEGYGVAVAAGLPVAGHAGLHKQPLALVVVVGCNLVRQRGARAHDAHPFCQDENARSYR